MNWKVLTWLLVFFAVLIWSAINPADRITWWLEVLPALIGLALLIYTRKTFPLTTLCYWLILAHCVILIVGGHYTYAEVPIGDWVAQWSGGERNNYDKLGHLAQGFVPAIIAREIMIRLDVVHGRGWLSYLVISITLAFSAFYELIEWWTALLSGAGAEAFLGTQGYIWDTQSDMFYALIGAIAALLLLSRIHDRQIKALS
jgi:putative membrane protein